ncbi:hypothetical protein SAMN05660816_04222 [Niastella yeongjuensis]|nr:hypothetical protein SAMN05660816_04222 [Niastella yeongjuensis]
MHVLFLKEGNLLNINHISGACLTFVRDLFGFSLGIRRVSFGWFRTRPEQHPNKTETNPGSNTAQTQRNPLRNGIPVQLHGYSNK